MRSENVLEKICATTRAETQRRKSETPLETLQKRADKTVAPRGFLKALKEKKQSSQPALIAEVKKASPSKGVIRKNFNPAEIAKAYEAGGAACISVLTDTPYFQGQNEILQQVREVSGLPVLRKDFMLEPYQIYESRVLGADCILLIMAALENETAQRLYDLSRSLGMDVLVEVHDASELHRTLTLNPDIIGINSRSLKTLDVDVNALYELVKTLPAPCFKVAESGIFTHDDIQALQQSGFDGFLVGESLMRQQDIRAATQSLLGQKAGTT